MRAVVSRVTGARVVVAGRVVGELTAPGLLVLLAVHRDDDPAVAPPRMARKLHELRLLRDQGERSDGERDTGERRDGKRDTGERRDGGRGSQVSCAEGDAGLLVVSQFTLSGDTRKGRRPSWGAAAPGDRARAQVDAVVAALRERGARVAEGVFGAEMLVESVNDGPYTVLVEV